MAERQGFEPWVKTSPTHALQACPFGRSGTSPKYSEMIQQTFPYFHIKILKKRNRPFLLDKSMKNILYSTVSLRAEAQSEAKRQAKQSQRLPRRDRSSQ